MRLLAGSKIKSSTPLAIGNACSSFPVSVSKTTSSPLRVSPQNRCHPRSSGYPRQTICAAPRQSAWGNRPRLANRAPMHRSVAVEQEHRLLVRGGWKRDRPRPLTTASAARPPFRLCASPCSPNDPPVLPPRPFRLALPVLSCCGRNRRNCRRA